MVAAWNSQSGSYGAEVTEQEAGHRGAGLAGASCRLELRAGVSVLGGFGWASGW